MTAKTEEALAEGSFGLPWFVGEYINPSKVWQSADQRQPQMLEEKKSAIGDLTILLKSSITWDSRGRNLVVST